MKNRKSFKFGLFFGTVLGVVLGLLYAPRVGRETRFLLKKKVEDLKKAIRKQWESQKDRIDVGKKVLSEKFHLAEETFERLQEKTSDGIQNLSHVLGEKADSFKEKLIQLREDVEKRLQRKDGADV